jgi:predicted metal-binding protein
VIGGQCDVCGSRKTGPCRACEGVHVVLTAAGINASLVMDWMEAVATKAAEDAVLRHENEEKHDG